MPAGRYPIEIRADSIELFATRKTSGVAFAVVITGGVWQGGECRLRFVLEEPPTLDRVVLHDLSLLERWAHAVGAGAASDC